MEDPVEFARRDAMLRSPTQVRQLNDGFVRVEKAGIVGVGLTLEAAIDDMTEKFAVAMRPPEET